MQSFHRLSLAAKLVLSFLVVAAVGAVIGGVGIFSVGRVSATTQRLYQQEFLSLKNIQQANIQLLAASRAQVALVAAGTRGERQQEAKTIQAAVAGIEARMTEVRPVLEQSGEGAKLNQRYVSLMSALKSKYAAFAALMATQTLDTSQIESRVLDEGAQLEKDARALERVLEEMVALSDQLAKGGMAQAAAANDLARISMVVAALAGIGVSIGLGVGAA